MLTALEELPPFVLIGFAIFLGLLVGSFLNVVIYRLPLMLDREQDAAIGEVLAQKVKDKANLNFLPLSSNCPQCHHTFPIGDGLTVSEDSEPPKPFNLFYPRSACPHCNHKIRWWENIPVLSWLVLRGRCAGCHAPISFRYPIFELLTGIVFGLITWHFGASVQTPLWCFFAAMCIVIAMIDWDTTWLPDSLSLSLMWAGLIAALLQWKALPIANALWGAIAGYLILWLVATIYKLLTGNIAMANGDFKMLAALGAWFGWPFLLPILLASSIVGAITGGTLKLMQSQKGVFEGKFIPFGPFLAGAGLVILICTPARIQAWFPMLFF